MSDQACSGVPVAAIGKVGVPSVSGGYGAADTICGRSDCDRGHAKDVPLLGTVFQRHAVFNLFTPNFTDATKNQFLEKSDPLAEYFQNLATKSFTGTWIHVFLSSFAEAEVTKRVRSIHHEKTCYFAPFSVASGTISPKLQDHSSPLLILLSSFVQIRAVRKCLPDSLQYRREACRTMSCAPNK